MSDCGYNARSARIEAQAWERFTDNGAGLDDDMIKETRKTVRDAVNNVWTEDMPDHEWLAATLKRLAR